MVSTLENYIYAIGKNNFPNRVPFNAKTTMEWVLPPEVAVISRTDLLKYILTCSPKTKRDTVIEKYIHQIKSTYPVVEKVESMFKGFHSLLMGKDETELDEYLEKYGESEIQSFCNGIKKDITPVKNAISFSVSSGFVEGNNNKFKVLKRIVYGRSGSINLEKNVSWLFCLRVKIFLFLHYYKTSWYYSIPANVLPYYTQSSERTRLLPALFFALEQRDFHTTSGKKVDTLS